MSWSLNEIEVLARKAARGSGMSWGLAEETGTAVRCLLVNGIDGPGLLAVLLDQFDGISHAKIAPADTDGIWDAPGGILCSINTCGSGQPRGPLDAPGGILCSINTGASLSDHAALLSDNGQVNLGRTAYPAFLIPFAQAIARHLDQVICLSWDNVLVYAAKTGVSVEGNLAALSLPETASVECRIAERSDGQLLGTSARAEISHDVAARLNSFAHRTYAPATDASRQSGAGAGLFDND